MNTTCKKIGRTINGWIEFLDKSHLEWLGILLIGVLMAPILYLGTGCEFEFSDQLDETILSYVFAARYPGAKIYEQMMNGIQAEGLKPSAILFVPLYRLFSVFHAFLIQYLIVLVSAFYGMYACVKRIGKSNIIAFLSATAFCMIPFYPIYGLSVMGVPLLLACVMSLREEWKLQGKGMKWNGKVLLNLLGISYFALTTNLVLVGYVVLILLAVVWCFELLTKRKNDKALFVTGILLFLWYCVTNLDLIKQLFTSAQFVSHREEFYIQANSFGTNFLEVLREGAPHAYFYHKYMWIPIALAVILLIIYRKKEGARRYLKIMGTVALCILVCMLLYAVLAGETVAAFRNRMGGMLKSFQLDRFYWVLPGAWHFLFGLALTVIYRFVKEKKNALLAILLVAVLYLPTILFVARNSIFYCNINRIKNANEVGYLTWERIYAEDLMSDIEKTIGRDMPEYRVASLGISPVVSLMHGFYTIDGYSNNYPISYKHEFREIIAGEMEKNSSIEYYFDQWGSRCYLFYSQWGTYYRLRKTANATIDEIDLNFDKMREMGCEYLFSAAEITCAEEKGLTFVDVFENENSYWRIWVYRL